MVSQIILYLRIKEVFLYQHCWVQSLLKSRQPQVELQGVNHHGSPVYQKG